MHVYRTLLLDEIPDEVISEDLVGFVERMVAKQKIFHIKSVPEGANYARITNAVIGYYPRYGIAYLSDPAKQTGISGIDTRGRRLVSSPSTPFFNHRDSFVYYMSESTYIREDYDAVLQEFFRKGYEMFAFVPAGIGDDLIWHTSFETIRLGEKILP